MPTPIHRYQFQRWAITVTVDGTDYSTLILGAIRITFPDNGISTIEFQTLQWDNWLEQVWKEVVVSITLSPVGTTPVSYIIFRGYVKPTSKNPITHVFDVSGSDRLTKIAEKKLGRLHFIGVKYSIDVIDEIIATNCGYTWSYNGSFTDHKINKENFDVSNNCLELVRQIISYWGCYNIVARHSGTYDIELQSLNSTVANDFEFTDDDVIQFDNIKISCDGDDNIINCIRIKNNEGGYFFEFRYYDSINYYGERWASEIDDKNIKDVTVAEQMAKDLFAESHRIWHVNWTMPLVPNIKIGNTIKITSNVLDFNFKGVVRNMEYNIDGSNGSAVVSIDLKCRRNFII